VVFLRHAEGYSLRDKERKDKIMSQLGMGKLDKQIHERKENWLEYIQRMPSKRAHRPLLYYQQVCRRDPGRSRKR
jgi:hypothetical protein